MHLLHAFRASVKNSLLFFLWIWKLNLNQAVKDRNLRLIRHLEVGRETGSRWLSKCIVGLSWGRICRHVENALDNHLDLVSCATSKLRISVYAYKPSSSVIDPYHRYNTLPTCLNLIEFDILKAYLTSSKCKKGFWSAPDCSLFQSAFSMPSIPPSDIKTPPFIRLPETP